MKKTAAMFAVFAVLIAGGQLLHAQRQGAVAAGSHLGGTEFEVVATNDIFNPGRAPYTEPEHFPTPLKTFGFTLNGVITYGDGSAYASFSGNTAGASRGYAVGDTINEFKVTEIANNTVTLTAPGGEVFRLRVGGGFTRVEAGPWKLVEFNSARPELSPVLDAGDVNADSTPADPVTARLRARRLADMSGSTTQETRQ